jgi:hypothetical protein
VLNVRDDFSTKNHFYGIQIGPRVHFVLCEFIFYITGTLALVRNIQSLTTKGQINLDNNRIIQPIGLFAEPSNIGTASAFCIYMLIL